jgi:riboflavin kinase/FMN adenylyltransferase
MTYGKKYVCSIGNFDGVHVGHQNLLEVVKDIAQKNCLQSLVYTFDKVAKLYKNYIYSLDTKLQLLQNLQVNKIYLLKFDKIWQLSPPQFFKKFIIEKNVAIIVVGEDFKFGRNATGDIKLLCELSKQSDVTTFVLKDFYVEVGENLYSVSSSLIRTKIIECKFNEVELLLGRSYFISGKKVSGLGLARKLGFPTINFLPEENLLVPKGVIAGFCKIKNKIFPSVANFGFKPTVENKKFVVEIHIIGRKIFVDNEYVFFRPIKKIRDEQKFSSVKELIKQVKKDITTAKKVLKQIL